MTAESRLEVAGLRVELAKSHEDIVDHVSFTVGAGKVLGLVGESGSGKTTVALAILGYVRPGARLVHGRVRIDGTDILSLSAQDIAQVRGATVAYVPQDPPSALNPALRIGDQIAEILEVHGRGLDPRSIAGRVAEMVEEVGLRPTREFLRSFPHQLSGGQQQRVCLAMAFLGEAKVIVLDEPTTGLDVVTQRRVLGVLRRLCARHEVAAVYVTHDLAVVAEVSDRIAVMYAGRVAELGGCHDVLTRPSHPYTAALLDAVPDLRTTTTPHGLPGRPPAPGRRHNGCAFAPRCRYADALCTAGPIELRAVREDWQVRCIRPEQVTHAPAAPPSTVTKPTALLKGGGGIRVTDLKAGYRNVDVLHGVSFELGPGKALALVGESGSGKTTLARCIVGLGQWRGGSITLNGSVLAESARARPLATRRALQYVFQNPDSSLNPRRTVGQSLATAISILSDVDRRYRRDRATRSRRISEALTEVGLDDNYAARYPPQLSGGERQRVALARALIVRPQYLICDEITSALDVSVQARIVELLKDLQNRLAVGLLFITHNLPLVSGLTDDVLVLKDGAIVEYGHTTDVLARPEDRYTQELLTMTPSLAGAAVAIGNGPRRPLGVPVNDASLGA